MRHESVLRLGPTSDWKKSRDFYQVALAPLGIQLLSNSDEWQASSFVRDYPQFWVAAGEPKNGEDELHTCFRAETREQVREFYEAAIKAGGRNHGAPGLRPHYGEHYYGAFVLDPDGHNIEANCLVPEVRD